MRGDSRGDQELSPHATENRRQLLQESPTGVEMKIEQRTVGDESNENETSVFIRDLSSQPPVKDKFVCFVLIFENIILCIIPIQIY